MNVRLSCTDSAGIDRVMYVNSDLIFSIDEAEQFMRLNKLDWKVNGLMVVDLNVRGDIVETGGGCTALRINLTVNGLVYALLTKVDESEAPSSNDERVDVGVYLQQEPTAPSDKLLVFLPNVERSEIIWE